MEDYVLLVLRKAREGSSRSEVMRSLTVMLSGMNSEQKNKTRQYMREFLGNLRSLQMW